MNHDHEKNNVMFMKRVVYLVVVMINKIDNLLVNLVYNLIFIDHKVNDLKVV